MKFEYVVKSSVKIKSRIMHQVIPVELLNKQSEPCSRLFELGCANTSLRNYMSPYIRTQYSFSYQSNIGLVNKPNRSSSLVKSSFQIGLLHTQNKLEHLFEPH